MDIIGRFKNPPKDYSPVPLWFWNGELKPEKLKRQIDEMVDKGVYGAFMHARAYLKTPYLEKEWWHAVDACIERGRETGFHPWLYDEYAWPSGTAGSVFEYGFQKPSRVLAEGECNMAKGLYVRTLEADSEASVNTLLAQEGTKPLAVFLLHGTGKAMQVSQFDVSVQKILPCTVMAFFRRVYPGAVDYLSKKTIRTFLDCTHEEYFKRYGDDFGSLIPGIFFDEIYMMGHPLPWTDSLPEEFAVRCGYDLMGELPFLIEEGGAHARQVRADYYRVIAELYEEAFFKQISQWCEQHHLLLTGHTEESLKGHPHRQGNYFDTMRHLHIPGADNHDYRYRFPRKITCCEPKYSVSVARANNRVRSMSESMGGAGWGCSLQQFKRGVNTMGAMGISMFVLHGFYYECGHQGSQADWPTSFFYQNPYWKYFKIFADYISRVSYMNTVGKPIVEVGLFYPIEEMQADTVGGNANAQGRGIDENFNTALNILLERQIDTDMIDARSILRADVSNGRVQVGQQAFRVLVCPGAVRMSQPLIDKLGAFRRAGGTVIFCRCKEDEKLPDAFADCVLCDVRQLPETIARLFTPDVYVSQGSRAELYVSHRSTDMQDCEDKADYYFVSNSSDRARSITLQLRCKGAVRRMNPETGEIRAICAKSVKTGTEIRLYLEADEACYLLFCREKAQPCAEWEDANWTAVTGKWEFLPLDKSYDHRWAIDARQTELEIPLADFSSELHEGVQQIRVCNRAEEPGFRGRHLSLWEGAWITRRPSWQDEMGAADLYFRKVITLPSKPEKADFCIAAVNEWTFYVNGESVARQQSCGRPAQVDGTPYLREGENLIAVHVHNSTPLHDVNLCSVEALPTDRTISLLLQGEIKAGGECMTLASDKSWIVCDKKQPGWQNPGTGFEQPAIKADPTRYPSFGEGEPDGVWLYAWERGTPPLLPWGDLPLFSQSLRFPVRLSYGVTLPAGTVLLRQPDVQGKYDCTLDGMPVCWQDGKTRVSPDGRTHSLQIHVTAAGAQDGLKQPVRVTLAPFQCTLSDWRLYGLSWFSGRAVYRNTVQIRKKEGRYLLNLGCVHFSAEVWVNGALAGTRIWEPYRVDITDLLKDGENELAIVAANSAANERRHMLVDEGMALGWNRYWNEDNIDREGENLVSGLLGPVRIYWQVVKNECR